MKRNTLPPDLRGDWIWMSHLLKKVDCHLFARKEFILDSAVPYAELWVSARYAYHVFINGVHVGYGPSPAARGLCYADRYEVSCHLQAGANVVAILSHSMSVPGYARPLLPPGVWCQLEIDGRPLVWTDHSWRVLDGSCYESGQPRRHSGFEFVERVNLESFPAGWSEPNFNDRGWGRPDLTRPVKEACPRLEASPCPKPPCSIYESDPLEPLAAGEFEESDESTHISFSNMLGGETGVYAAQTYFRSATAMEVPVKIASDDPFVLFCDDRLELSRGVFPAHSGQANMKADEGLYLQSVTLSDTPFATGILRVKAGWNRLLAVQEAGSNSMGFMLVFPGLKNGSFKFMREDNDEAIPGWKLSGPLKMSLAAATGSLRLERMPSLPYTAIKENVNDVSSWLSACAFKPKPGTEAEVSAKGLKAGDFAIYDIGSVQYGFPFVDLVGGGGDIVDVTCGPDPSGDAVPSFGPSGRNTDTLTLRAGDNRWLKFDPRDARRIMLTVRKSSSRVFPTVKFANFVRERDEEAEFSCSDQTFNKIWETGKATLRQTANFRLMDSPCGTRSQSLPEAFIQSMACIYSFGECDLSEKALREFALSQTENGNIPEFSSNDIYSYVPDYALLWPMWLEAHWQASGDAAFRDEMLPHLDLLLDFFGTIAAEDGGALVNLDGKYRMKCVIDHADIDRRGMSTALNALYCRALLSAASIYSSAGKADLVQSCRDSASRTAAIVRKMAFDEEKGLFSDCCDHSGRSDRLSVQTNIIALLSGVVPPAFSDRLVAKLSEMARKPDAGAPSPYFNYFLLETLFAFGRQDEALRFIKEYWGGMLAAGAAAWWSSFDPSTKSMPPGAIQCYGGASSPNIFLIRELAGIRAAVPGFSKIYFNPAVKMAKHAKVKLPTPYGKIILEWKLGKDGSLEVDADANYPLDIAPMLPQELFEKCTFTLGKSVSVLEPESAP